MIHDLLKDYSSFYGLKIELIFGVIREGQFQ